MLITLLRLLPTAALLATALARPLSTHGADKRSYPSNGLTCFFQCPATATYYTSTISYASGGNINGIWYCYYGPPTSPDGSCEYDPTTGEYLGSQSSGGTFTCITDVGPAQCGTEPVRGFRKRSQRDIERELKRSQKGYDAIAARQYKPRV
ncbi:hypothetical protein JCM24511_06680 [Saitozyma sp. JCM 24511]|nr:hypothetical protein JCM24511_06680 [Saitozyma sp. JCM 24511]